MQSPLDAILGLVRRGYDQNFVPCFDHLEAADGAQMLYPRDFVVDEILRFENTSDPDDQAILYAITSELYRCKGSLKVK